MAKSVSQHDFFGNTNMYYMAAQGISDGKMEADLFHNSQLKLQECVRNPIVFHAEMMSDIMYLHHTIRQPGTDLMVGKGL